MRSLTNIARLDILFHHKLYCCAWVESITTLSFTHKKGLKYLEERCQMIDWKFKTESNERKVKVTNLEKQWKQSKMIFRWIKNDWFAILIALTPNKTRSAKEALGHNFRFQAVAHCCWLTGWPGWLVRLAGCQVARSSRFAAHCCCWPTKEGAGVRKEDWFLINLDWKMLANDIFEDIYR